MFQQRPDGLAAPARRSAAATAEPASQPSDRAREGREQRLDEDDEPALPAGAPAELSRASSASTSGRSRAATSTANASSRATASPPSSSRRRPATGPSRPRRAARPVGAVSSKPKLEPWNTDARVLDPRRPGRRPTTSAPCRAAAARPSRSCGTRRAAPASGRAPRRRSPARAAAVPGGGSGRIFSTKADSPQVLRRDRVAEQRRGTQVALADRHEPQARHVRDPARRAGRRAPRSAAAGRRAAGGPSAGAPSGRGRRRRRG